MVAKNPEEEGLTLDDRRWMGARLGIDVDVDGAAKPFFEKMKVMAQGKEVQVDGEALTMVLLAKEMVEANVGIGFIPSDSRFERETTEQLTANLAASLYGWICAEVGLEQMRKPAR